MSNFHSTVGMIGLGLIGGSMALDLKRRGFAKRGVCRWYADNTGWTDFLLDEKKLNEE